MKALDMLYFYLSPSTLLPNLPKSRGELSPNYLTGEYAWILQTYLVLKEKNVPCELVSKFPDKGIVVVHRSHIPKDYRPNNATLLVCVQADYSLHWWAQAHVVQNKAALKRNLIWSLRHLFPPTRDTYIRHWPQPNLVPRSSERGNRFENLAFFGTELNMDPYLRSNEWLGHIKNLGLNWLPKFDPKTWHDYNDVDCIVAVRSFSEKPKSWKPPTKLFNAWLAGAPIIVEPYSAYFEERRSENDFCVSKDPAELVDWVQKLKTSPTLREKFVNAGRSRVKDCSVDTIAQTWIDTLNGTWLPLLDKWQESPVHRNLFFLRAFLGNCFSI
ncbi:MAG: hypothetical protein A4S09_00355 [Proteobacteria bacterium SG_bin7]|nr:MAG: hypothetical protein A4S09_00355 [Proteobacteria bacterium SG_bin7]